MLSLFVVAVLGLGLNEAAYAAEIVRAGIISVDQWPAGGLRALGFPGAASTARIILPQATRTIIPDTPTSSSAC